MKETAYFIITILFTAVLIGACEKEAFFEYDEAVMSSFHDESTLLPQQTTDSIKSFSRKVDSYISIFPEAEKSEYYPKIIGNIASACVTLNLVIKIDTTWAGHIYVNF